MDWYKGKKVYITGGSKGIGKAAALQLARAGASVVVGARGQEALDATVAEMEAAGGPGQVFGTVSVDVTDREAVKAAAPRVLEILGGLDVLVCNSGFAWLGMADDIDEDAFEAMIDTNYLGHVYTTRSLLPHLKDQKSGHIHLVSSMLGFMGLPGYTAYCGSKYAIAGFAEALRMDLKPHGVTVTLSYPPTTDTPGLEKENENKPRVTWLMEHDSMFSTTSKPDDVARTILGQIRSGRFETTHGQMNHLIWNFVRLFPRIARWTNDDEMNKAYKKMAKETR